MTHEHRELRACGCVIVHKRVEVCVRHSQLPPEIRDRLSEMVSKVMADEIDAAVELERKRILKKVEEFRCSAKAEECTARHFGYNLAIDDMLEVLREPSKPAPPEPQKGVADEMLSQAMEILTKIVDSERHPAGLRCDAQQLLRRWQRGEHLQQAEKRKCEVCGGKNSNLCSACMGSGLDG